MAYPNTFETGKIQIQGPVEASIYLRASRTLTSSTGLTFVPEGGATVSGGIVIAMQKVDKKTYTRGKFSMEYSITTIPSTGEPYMSNGDEGKIISLDLPDGVGKTSVHSINISDNVLGFRIDYIFRIPGIDGKRMTRFLTLGSVREEDLKSRFPDTKSESHR